MRFIINLFAFSLIVIATTYFVDEFITNNKRVSLNAIPGRKTMPPNRPRPRLSNDIKMEYQWHKIDERLPRDGEYILIEIEFNQDVTQISMQVKYSDTLNGIKKWRYLTDNEVIDFIKQKDCKQILTDR